MTTYESDKLKIISFFSIVLVVFLHSYNLEGVAPLETPLYFGKPVWFIEDFFSYGITRTAVPLFFLFSGFLFFLDRSGENVFARKIKRRFYTLFIPFMFWSLAGIALYFTLQTIPQTAVFFTKEHVVNYRFSDWLFKIFVIPIPYQLWFIRDLMLLVLLSPVLNYLLEKLKGWFLLPIAIYWFYVSGVWFNSIEALLFFCTGGFMAMHRPQLIGRRNIATWFWTACWILLTAIKTFLLSVNADPILIQMLFRTSVLCGIIAVWGLYDVWPGRQQKGQSRLLAVGSFTFFVYAAHEPVLTIIKKLLFVIFGQQENNYLQVYILSPCIAIVFAIVVGWIMRRYCRSLYQIITGGR